LAVARRSITRKGSVTDHLLAGAFPPDPAATTGSSRETGRPKRLKKTLPRGLEGKKIPSQIMAVSARYGAGMSNG
jgi:hypothetical protein